MPDNNFNFKNIVAKFNANKVDLPLKLSKVAHDYFLSSMTKSMWNGERYVEVKRRMPGTPEYNYPKDRDLPRRTRAPLLGKSRNLFKSIVNSQRKATWEEVRLGSDVPYAQYQNEGTENIPQRKFMGHSEQLDKLHKQEIKKNFDKVFKLK